VEILLHAEHQSLILWNPFNFVAPFPGNLDSCLDSLSTRVHWQHHVETEHLSYVFREARKHVVVECSAAECQPRGLLDHRFDEFRVAMALIHGAVGR